jgi:hypothetical protein
MKYVFHLAVVLAALCGQAPARAEIDTNGPLPAITNLLTQVLKRAQTEDENSRKFTERYHFEQTGITEVRNTEGRVKKRIEEAETNDGHPAAATPSAAGATDPKAGTAAHSPKTHAASKQSKQEPEANSVERNDFPVTSDLLARYDFTVLGHEGMNSRRTLVVDFKPIQGKKPEHDLKDKFINRTAGRLWIDAEDYAIARATLHLIDRVKVVGGLAASVATFTCDLQRERTPDGLWFLRNANWHLEGREFLFPFIVDYHEEIRDLRPLPLITISKNAPQQAAGRPD